MTDKQLVPSLVTGGAPAPIVPRSFDDVYRLAQVLCASNMVPDSYKGEDNLADCTVAIMQGLEVGLSPIAAVNSIAVINGRPSIWGDGALAIVRASDRLEYIKEWHDEATNTAYCEVKRKGESESVVRTFSEADSKKAGLWTKKGPWQTYPKRMLQMRARSWALRDVFADVMKGMSVAEEMQDIDITPQDYNEVPEVPAIPDIPDAPEPPVEDPMLPVLEQANFLESLQEQMMLAGDNIAIRNEIWEDNVHLVARLDATNRAEAEKMKPDQTQVEA